MVLPDNPHGNWLKPVMEVAAERELAARARARASTLLAPGGRPLAGDAGAAP